jgi:hypothetical protein
MRLFVSSANADIVVRDPQNPTAIRREYFASRFQMRDKTEKTPRIKLPIRFMIRTSDLTEAVKQTLYEEYLKAYSESNQ